MDEAVEKELLRIARIDRVARYAKQIGATDELAEIFAESQARNFVWDGVDLKFSGRNCIDDEKTREHFTTGKLAALFPNSKKDGGNVVDPALLERARTNLTAKGALVRQLGSVVAADAALAGKPKTETQVSKPNTDNKTDPNNPFVGLRDAAGKVDLAKQAAVAQRIRQDGIGVVVKLAKEAGVTLGGHPLRKAS